jgi:hypothetical protein
MMYEAKGTKEFFYQLGREYEKPHRGRDEVEEDIKGIG